MNTHRRPGRSARSSNVLRELAWTRWVGCLGLLMILGACGRQDTDSSVEDTSTALVTEEGQFLGEILEYESAAMSDTYQDGRFSVFDRCRIRILDEDPETPDTISVYLELTSDSPEPSIFHSVGRKILFSMDRDLLLGSARSGHFLMGGALSDVQLLIE